MACFVSYSYTSFHWKTNSLIRKTEICRKKGTGKVYSSRDLVAALPKTPTPQKDPVQEKKQTKRSNETSTQSMTLWCTLIGHSFLPK
ncbi:Probable NADH dehydrogenase [Galdieria sulphuraria]|nr:Probable NADH dehydrogenase [Galdieria sulphuraria]